MNTSMPEDQVHARSPEAAVFAFRWLRGTPGEAVRTVLVAVVVEELLVMLRDQGISNKDAHRGLCRAVRLLGVLAAESHPARVGRRTEYEYDYPANDRMDWNQLTRAGSARRFATQTLRGSLPEAIRTEPVIALVDELLTVLMNEPDPSTAHTALRRAVRLLGVYVKDDLHQY